MRCAAASPAAMSSSPVDRVDAWRRRGERFRHGGRSLHLYRQDGHGPPILLLHGFPSSSFDWQRLVDGPLAGHRLIAPDFLGFGLSEKPRDHTYSLLWQADMLDALVAEYAGDGPIQLVAHDMGTSVATELLARDIEGTLGFALAGALLFNGSIVLERASLTWAQKLLRSPAGPLAARLSSRPVFERQFGRLFSAGHPLSAEEARDQWQLVCEGGGRTLGHKLVHYLGERVELAGRWHGAIARWPGDFRLLWGTADPVATTAVLDALIELRPEVPVERLEGIGHYPQIEVPERVGQAIQAAAQA